MLDFFIITLAISLIAVLIDVLYGEIPGKHLVEYFGDYINFFNKKFYANSVFRGFVLLISFVFIVGLCSSLMQYQLFYVCKSLNVPVIIPVFIIGIVASMGLSSHSLKKYIGKVIFCQDEKEKRENLKYLVTRNPDLLNDKQVYSSTFESYAENFSDGIISPLFYLICFGLPGIMIYKAINTLDSMVGYKNSKYINYGKCSAIMDDILNFIPARITTLIFYIFKKPKDPLKKILQEAKLYSTSPNAGYPVSMASHAFGVKVGGVFYYGDTQVNKAIIGSDEDLDSKQACINFYHFHKKIDIALITSLLAANLFSILIIFLVNIFSL